MTVDPQARQRGVLHGRGEPVEREARPPEGPTGSSCPREDGDPKPATDDGEAGEREHRERRDDLVVRGLPGGADDQDRQADRGHDLGYDEPGRREHQGQPRKHQHPTDHAGEPGVGQVAEPPGVVGAGHVERQEPEGDGGERLRGDAQPASAQPVAEGAGHEREADEDRRTTADAEPGPGLRQEDHRGDEEAQGPEAEQDLGDRGRAQAVRR